MQEDKENKSYTLQVGPQHPALIEPEHLELTIEGETVIGAKINMGYIHRGIEGLMQGRTYTQNIYLAERVCGICSLHHTLTYCMAAEAMLNLEVPARADYIRVIIAELERLHSHLLWLGVAGHEIGMDTLFQYAWKDREHVMDILESITGNRVNYSMCAIGGARRDISKELLAKTAKVASIIDERTKKYVNMVSNDRSVLARTKGIGILRKQDAAEFGAVGPLARASDVDEDIRSEGYCCYDDIVWNVATDKGSDVFARVAVRLSEMIESASILKQCAKKIPSGDIRAKAPFAIPAGEAVCRSEAPRGELLYHAISNGTDKPERVKIKTPTYANLMALKEIVTGAQLADIPVIVASIDPCFSCADRVTLIDSATMERKSATGAELRRMRL